MPTLTAVSNFTGATEDQKFAISYSALRTKANESPNTDGFQITLPTNGTLWYNNSATATPNYVQITDFTNVTVRNGGVWVNNVKKTAFDANLYWQPAADASGLLPAFSVQAVDNMNGIWGDAGDQTSAPAVVVNINVASVPDVNSIAIVPTGAVLSGGFVYFNAGDTISIQVGFDEAVNVTGAPRFPLVLDSGTYYADYASGTGTTVLTFTYTVLAGHTDSVDGIDIVDLDLNGGTITSVASAATADLSFLTANNSFLDGWAADAIVDTTAPPSPTLSSTISVDTGASATDNITSDTTLTVTGVAEAGSTVSIFDTDGVTVLGTGTADGVGAYSITTSVLGAGAHTLYAGQVDIAGNVSVLSAGVAVTIDTAAPAAPSAPDLATASDSFLAPGTNIDDITNVTTPVFNGTGAEAGATVTLYDTDGVTVLGTATADGAGAWSITSSTLAAGAHTITAKQTDLAGNVSAASAGLAVTIDTSAAAPVLSGTITTDTGVSAADNITSDTTVTVTGSGAEVNATVTLYDTDGVTVLGTGTADGAGNYSITSSVLADGAHTLTTKQTDIANNTSAASNAVAVTIDTAAAAPTLSSTISVDTGASATDNITSDNTLTVTGVAEAGAAVTIYDTDTVTVLGTGTANGVGAYSITTSVLADGVHTLYAGQVDVAGNTSAQSAGVAVTIDTAAAAPSAPDLATASDSFLAPGTNIDDITNVTTPVFNGTGAEAGATVTLYDTDGVTVLGTATADGAGAWSITSSTLAAGAHTITAKQTDLAGNVSAASAGLAVTIDTSAAAPVLSGTITTDTGVSAADNITSDTTVTVTGSGAEVNATVTLYDTDGVTVLGTGTADGAGNYSITSSVLADGAHTLTTKQTDIANNTSTASNSVVVTVDTAAPTNTFTSAYYDPTTDILTLTGGNMSSLLSTGQTSATNIAAQLNWANLIWDVDGTNLADQTFVLGDIVSANVLNNGALAIELNHTAVTGKAAVIEALANYGFNGTAVSDTIDVTAGFSVDAAGNAAATDAIANAALLGAFNLPTPVFPNVYSYNVATGGNVINESTGAVAGVNAVAFTAADVMLISGASASQVTVGGSALSGGAGDDTISISGGGTLTLTGYTAAMDGAHVLFDDGTILKTNNTGVATTLTGGNAAGGDYFSAGSGGDMLLGYGGSDTLYGGTGNDAIYGGSGNDFIWGNQGNDYLDGGTGVDTFLYSIAVSGDGNDVVSGFTSGGGGDVIRLNDIADASLDAAWISANAVQNGADTLVTLNGSETIRLLGVTASNLTVDNFLGN